MIMSAVEVKGVGKIFRSQSDREICALHNVTITIRNGELTVILGPTGCGKTTTLRIIAGLLAPDSGTVSSAEGIGYIPQFPALFPWMTVRENIEFPLSIRKLHRSARSRESHRVLEQLDLEEAAGIYPYECSGGMQQRIMMAQQILAGSKIWLLDEPFGSVDEITRYKLQDLLLRIVEEESVSVLFVTHSVEEAVYLADTVFVFSARPGTVIAEYDLPGEKPRDRLGVGFADDMLRVRLSLTEAIYGSDK